VAGNISQRVIAYIADIKDVVRKTKEIERLNKSIAQNLGKQYANVSQKIGRSYSDSAISISQAQGQSEKFAGSMVRTTSTVKTADGQLKTLTETTRLMSDNTKKTTVALTSMDKNTVSLGQNIARLAKRAALTIPIWLALRGAVMGTFRTISDGIKTIAAQDRAFQKARRNLSATAKSNEELATNMQMLKDETLKLSLQTGKSIEELTNAFQKFATVGFDAQTSLVGMQTATKLATVEFGDAVETANAFARTMRILIDTSEGAKSQSDQIAEAMALTDQLWQTNAFEINEFTQNLLKFAGTAKAANLSTRETITLLATLSTGGLGSRAGRLLRTTILKALQNLDEVAQSLNLHIDPAVDSTFDVVLKLVSALRELSKTQNVPKELVNVLGDLFTVRTTEVLASLRALETTLKANAEVAPDIKKLDGTFNDVTDTTGILTEKITNLNREIGKAFVLGLTGADDFNTALQEIVKTLIIVRENAQKAGNAVSTFVTGIGTFGIGVPFLQLSRATKSAADSLAKLNIQINKGLAGNLDIDALEKLINTLSHPLKFEGFKDVIVPEPTLKALKEILANQKEITESTANQADNEKKITKEKQKQQQVITSLKTINEAILEHRLDQLKQLGYQESAILKAEGLLRNQLGLIDTYEDKLNRQLEIERAINEEKRLQNKLSSDSVKLFEISKTEGVAVAKKIGDVLAGEIDFSTFIRRGGKAVEVFKKDFADVYKQQQALAFFRGERVPGLKGLRGGSRIAIEEEGIRRRVSDFDVKAELQRQKLIREAITPVSTRNVNNTFNQNNQITQNITVQNVSNKEDMVKANLEALQDPRYKQALAKILIDKQTPTL